MHDWKKQKSVQFCVNVYVIVVVSVYVVVVVAKLYMFGSCMHLKQVGTIEIFSRVILLIIICGRVSS